VTKPLPDPPKDLKEIRQRFIVLIGLLVEQIELRANMDIRDKLAALSLIERVLAREKTDDDAERAGSKVKQYQSAFQTANGGRGGASDPRRGDQPGDGEPDEPADDERESDDDGEEDARADAGIPVT
jgi:hypothetical protein